VPGRLADKVAVVTGAGSGIARASARLFAEEGAAVVALELRPELGESTERDIRAAGGEATFVETDVTDEAAVLRAVEQAVSSYGRIDCLFNCAGGSLAEDGPLTEISLTDVWEQTVALNLLGTVLACRHVIPELVKAGGGAVVNTSSSVALKGSRGGHVYSMTKGGIVSLTRTIAATYAKDNVRANTVCPGTIVTEGIRQRFGVDDERLRANLEEMSARYPFGVGEPRDIAAVALFLVSPESRMVTGATIPADGGYSAY
jgi:NAD(P)-dependent dehydrogenase (short-subunit alcohol dehydrogenase family)